MSGLINAEPLNCNRAATSPGASPYAAVGSSLCELAALNDKEPLQFLLSMLADPRNLEPERWGSRNCSAASLGLPIDAGRMRNVLLLAAARSGWRSPLPPRLARGIAAHYDLLTYIGTVTRVSVADDGRVGVSRIDLAIDCGTVADRARVADTFRRAAVKAVSEALHGALKFSHDDAPSPDIRVHIMRSEGPFGGIGEIAITPVIAAIVNAVFAATGQRSRRLPISPALLKLH